MDLRELVRYGSWKSATVRRDRHSVSHSGGYEGHALPRPSSPTVTDTYLSINLSDPLPTVEVHHSRGSVGGRGRSGSHQDLGVVGRGYAIPGSKFESQSESRRTADGHRWLVFAVFSGLTEQRRNTGRGPSPHCRIMRSRPAFLPCLWMSIHAGHGGCVDGCGCRKTRVNCNQHCNRPWIRGDPHAQPPITGSDGTPEPT
jgi:hypothetical protein